MQSHDRRRRDRAKAALVDAGVAVLSDESHADTAPDIVRRIHEAADQPYSQN
ncbi:hypothetical protein HUX88_03330 [Duganella sp. BJB1802]|uniref:hypothetical protein n=1 Tax=Duganella sp. BJB1802 TaxID=2744575 RepID=UPI0015942EEA|nr:hypothetical protein [Duganella sp. BJB1802]NVD69589.1 hypothetical protein [Duganella sp. BJB1802]